MTKDEIKVSLQFYIKVGEDTVKFSSSVETKEEYNELIEKYNTFYVPVCYLLSQLTDQTLANSFEFNQQLYNPDSGDRMYVGGDRRYNLPMSEDIQLIKTNLIAQIKFIRDVHDKLKANTGLIETFNTINEEFIFSKVIDTDSSDYKTLHEYRNLHNYRQENERTKDIQIQRMKKIFISHSSNDKKVVEEILTMLELIGIKQEIIFCSSFEGYGVNLGENFLERLKEELNDNVFVLFILSNNFYNSPICLCEMGAAWIKTSYHIPILIPPLNYKDIKGVIPLTQGFSITEKLKLNLFKSALEKMFNLVPIDGTRWERSRDNSIERITNYIENYR